MNIRRILHIRQRAAVYEHILGVFRFKVKAEYGKPLIIRGITVIAISPCLVGKREQPSLFIVKQRFRVIEKFGMTDDVIALLG